MSQEQLPWRTLILGDVPAKHIANNNIP